MNPLFYRLFMLQNLPAAYFTGVRIVEISEGKAVVSVNQKWFNKNPFHSIYFAVLSMAAELSTGVLCLGNIYDKGKKVSMLVMKIEGVFHKKATGKIIFACRDGVDIRKTIEEAIATKDPKTITCHSYGKNNNNETVADFYVTWSFKARD